MRTKFKKQRRKENKLRRNANGQQRNDDHRFEELLSELENKLKLMPNLQRFFGKMSQLKMHLEINLFVVSPHAYNLYRLYIF